MHQKVILVVFDGFGISPNKRENAIMSADMPNYNHLIENYPKASLSAAAVSVGLIWGTTGNSEIGHVNIGSGRVVWQELSRISRSIEDKSFFQNPIIVEACNHAVKNNKALHLIGLASDGAVHSHISHLYALLKAAREKKVDKIFVHLITDGRDTAPQKVLEYLPELNHKLESTKAKIASVSGRYFAMDRDKRWDRTEKAYKAIVGGVGNTADSLEEAINNAYQKKQTDEFIEPTVIVDKDKKPIGLISDNDAVIFFNFRSDRSRQLSQAIADEHFNAFKKTHKQNLYFATMTNYELDELNTHIIFPEPDVTNTLGEVISNNGLRQLHIAETEKYAHVTYFFNGGREEPYPKEDRIMIRSPKVPTYDLKPEMSAYSICQKLCEEINENKYDFIVVNFANPDMVGHTGNFKAAVKACEAVDECLGKITDASLKHDYALILTSDHGNCEQMIDPKTGQIQKEHTADPVPFIVVTNDNKKQKSISEQEKMMYLIKPPVGVLADIAPTVLDLMGLKVPTEMSGMSLINNLY
ncbi:MAG: 2,3-bisphosphoglycerate-independent phosphoglycerate mutase [Candidatus Berkelbacteria bacterium]|nr:2,3-bisphosphoglycerate-independent phosphoglycerate mutase [Candidatus Berkelbacteria bacterium]